MGTEHEFYSIVSEVSAETKIKGSRFIAHACPIDGRDSAEAFVERISRRFHDATHNCFAYKIGMGDQADFRFSDAGEPSGTAGRPILHAIESRNLTDVVVVVTRYFGGTKLGTGGLIRAYNAAVLAALNKAEQVQRFSKITLCLKFDYQLANAVHNILNRFDGQIIESKFDKCTTYLVSVKAAEKQSLREALQNISRGKIEISKVSG